MRTKLIAPVIALLMIAPAASAGLAPTNDDPTSLPDVDVGTEEARSSIPECLYEDDFVKFLLCKLRKKIRTVDAARPTGLGLA